MSFLRFMLMSLILLSTTLWAGVGKVALLKGEATLERGVQKLALQNGTALEEKDIIKTLKDAQVQLMFEDKTVITLGSESEFKIEEYLNDTKNPKAKFKFNQGAFKTITGQIGKTAPDNFKLETKTATIGIRGTIVAGNVPPPPPPAMPPLPEAIFCLSGTITVAPITMPNIIVIVPTGSFTQMLTPSTPPSPPAIFTPADLQQLNQNLGGTPPPPPPSGGTPPQGGNTPPTGNPDGGNDAPPPPPAPAPSPTPQTFTPTAAGTASQNNAQNTMQELVLEKAAEELGVDKDKLKEAIATDKPIEEIVKEIIPPVVDPVVPPVVDPVVPPVVDPVVPPVVDPVVPPVTPPSAGGGAATPTTVTKTLTVLGARESMNDTYMYLEPTTVTLTGTSSTSLSGSLIAPLFSDVNASLISTQTIPITNVPENLLSMWGGEQLLIFGTPITSLPTDGIIGFQEVEDLGNAKMGTNFKNKRALIVDFDSEDNGLFLFFGTLENTASLGGSIYSYGVGFSDHTEGNATGLFFGTSTVPYHVGLIGVDFNGSHYSAGAYAGFQTDYKATANISGDLTLTGLTTSLNSNRSNYKDDIELTIARSTGNTAGIITLHDDQGVTSGSYALNQSDANKSSYIHDNYFAITGFDTQESWLVSFRTDVNFTTPDSALSWGIWAVNETNSSKLLPYYNYWVAGSTLTDTAAINALASNYTQYTYDGKALGVVTNNGSATPINSSDSNNAVRFVFNFGLQNPINPNESYIRFGSWDLAPSNGVIANNFSGDLVGVNMNGFIGGEFYGLFYGTNAESIGGTFGASDETLGNARGVFVATNAIPQTPDLALVGLATASKITSGTMEHPHENEFATVLVNSYAYGEIGGVLELPFHSNSVSVTSPTIFTITIPDSNITQISSITSPDSNVLWGTWTSTSDNNATLLPTANNFWVAGKVADRALATSHIASIYSSTSEYKTYTYLGKTLGVVYDASHTAFPIDPSDPTNEVKLVFKFGNGAAPLAWPDGHIQFTANGFWDIRFYPGPSAASANGTFSETISSGTIGGHIDGAFYGTNAASLGGTFNATDSNNNSNATGAFVASKTNSETSYIPLAVSGYGTSMYLDSGDTKYRIQDAVDFNISNHTSASGTSTLFASPTTVDINTSSASISTFGPSTNSLLYWGKWTSTELDDGNTTLASADNFWVAGVKKADAATYIGNFISDSRTPILNYEGNVIGSTYASGTRYAIDEDANNKVKLQFNLGESYPLDAVNSEITFVSNSKTWILKPNTPTSYISGGTFSSSFDPASSSIASSTFIDGSLYGTFYGTSADAAGGSFQARADSNTLTALGVFKAIKKGEFFYPTSFYPTLNMPTTNDGVVNYTGFATSRYISGATTYDSISDSFDLSINTSDDVTSGMISYAGRAGNFSLDRDGASGGDTTYTYTNANDFAIKDFTAGKGWIQTDNSEPNDYVSWGYWAVHSTDEAKLKGGGTFWVGGDETNATAAIAYIAGLSPTHYTYIGKVIGTVEEGGASYNIASNTSSVQLKFDFGGGTNALYNDLTGTQYNWIRFEANNKQWDLRPTLTTPNVTSGTFSDTLSGTVATTTPITTGAIKGKFYGDQAQAVGGTFNAATATEKAIGVFKAVRP